MRYKLAAIITRMVGKNTGIALGDSSMTLSSTSSRSGWNGGGIRADFKTSIRPDTLSLNTSKLLSENKARNQTVDMSTKIKEAKEWLGERYEHQ